MSATTLTSGTRSRAVWLTVIVIGSVLVAAGRFTVPGHGASWPGSYEAVAHIWVGVLMALGFVGEHKKVAWLALALITVVEVVMAVLR